MRNIYTPDRWVVVRCFNPEEFEENQRFDCVLAGWTGGYLDGASWRRSTPIMRRETDGDYIVFVGNSGSSYRCHSAQYGLTSMTATILETMEKAFVAVGGTCILLKKEEL